MSLRESTIVINMLPSQARSMLGLSSKGTYEKWAINRQTCYVHVCDPISDLLHSEEKVYCVHLCA